MLQFLPGHYAFQSCIPASISNSTNLLQSSSNLLPQSFLRSSTRPLEQILQMFHLLSPWHTNRRRTWKTGRMEVLSFARRVQKWNKIALTFGTFLILFLYYLFPRGNWKGFIREKDSACFSISSWLLLTKNVWQKINQMFPPVRIKTQCNFWSICW